MEHLKGDMQHLARRMKVKCPPLESATAKEFKIENEYILQNPKATAKNFNEVAKKFKLNFPEAADPAPGFL
jgi:NACalpha-BTF3-like transcription factor